MERGTDCFRGRLEGPGGAPGVRDTFHCITTRLKSSKVIKSQQLLADVGTPRDLEGESWVVWILFYLRLTFSHKTLSKLLQTIRHLTTLCKALRGAARAISPSRPTLKRALSAGRSRRSRRCRHAGMRSAC